MVGLAETAVDRLVDRAGLDGDQANEDEPPVMLPGT
jgi:hypothetical protein